MIKRRLPVVAAAFVPLPVVAVALLLRWSHWIALALLLVAVAVCAELIGTVAGVVAALVSTAGFALVVAERTARVGTARGGPELGALAALITVAMLFGYDGWGSL